MNNYKILCTIRNLNNTEVYLNPIVIDLKNHTTIIILTLMIIGATRIATYLFN